jgi:hypothetical protein
MAIVHANNTASSGATTFGSPYTFTVSSFNVGTGEQRYLIVGVAYYASSATLTGVTYAGNAMTQVDVNANGSVRVAMYYQANPTSGSNNIVATFSSSNSYVVVGAEAVTGAYQGAPPTTSKTTGSSATTITRDITTSYANSWVIDAVDIAETWTPVIVAGSGQTERADDVETQVHLGMSTEPTTTAGSVTMSWSYNVSPFTSEWATILAEIREGAITAENVNTVKANIVSPVSVVQYSKAHSGSKFYSREDKTSLPADVNPMATFYSNTEVSDVDSDNATRVSLSGVNYPIHMYQYRHTNNTDNITISWNGQTDLAPSTSTVYLQIYNYNSSIWDTLDSDNSSSANSDFTLEGSKTTSVSNYYSTIYLVSVRVYQQSV